VSGAFVSFFAWIIHYYWMNEIVNKSRKTKTLLATKLHNEKYGVVAKLFLCLPKALGDCIIVPGRKVRIFARSPDQWDITLYFGSVTTRRTWPLDKTGKIGPNQLFVSINVVPWTTSTSCHLKTKRPEETKVPNETSKVSQCVKCENFHFFLQKKLNLIKDEKFKILFIFYREFTQNNSF
jgi:hypothetical protein